MIKNVYGIFDVKAQAYLPPFQEVNKAVAIRKWADLVNNTQTPFNAHPEDYILFELGKFDELKGTFENLHTPQSLAPALEVLNRKDQ